MGVDGSETDNLIAINRLMEKLEQLNADLASMVSEVRLTNPIVGNVLNNAKKAMGLVTSTAKENDEKRKKIWGCQSVMRIMITMMKMLLRMKILLRRFLKTEITRQVVKL